MSRANLERRPTLDELFGPDPFKEGIEGLRRLVEGNVRGELADAAEATRHEEVIRLLEIAYRTRPEYDFSPILGSIRCELSGIDVPSKHDICIFLSDLSDRPYSPTPRARICGFWRMTFHVGPRHEGEHGICQIRPFPSFWQWIEPVKHEFRRKFYQKMKSCVKNSLPKFVAIGLLRFKLERLAALTRIALDRCLSAIEDALAMLRNGNLGEAPTPISARTFRELIGQLLTPQVLAAGGDFDLFVARR